MQAGQVFSATAELAKANGALLFLDEGQTAPPPHIHTHMHACTTDRSRGTAATRTPRGSRRPVRIERCHAQNRQRPRVSRRTLSESPAARDLAVVLRACGLHAAVYRAWVDPVRPGRGPIRPGRAEESERIKQNPGDRRPVF